MPCAGLIEPARTVISPTRASAPMGIAQSQKSTSGVLACAVETAVRLANPTECYSDCQRAEDEKPLSRLMKGA